MGLEVLGQVEGDLVALLLGHLKGPVAEEQQGAVLLVGEAVGELAGHLLEVIGALELGLVATKELDDERRDFIADPVDSCGSGSRARGL